MDRFNNNVVAATLVDHDHSNRDRDNSLVRGCPNTLQSEIHQLLLEDDVEEEADQVDVATVPMVLELSASQPDLFVPRT